MWAIFTAMLMLVGCSGQGVIVVHNLSGETISVKVISNEKRHDFLETGITQGDEIDTIRWHGLPPKWIEVAVRREDGRSESRRWLKADYPPIMQDGSSLTEYFVLEIGPNEMILRDPTTWDAVRRNPIGYGLLVGIPGGVGFAAVIAIRRSLLNRASGS